MGVSRLRTRFTPHTVSSMKSRRLAGVFLVAIATAASVGGASQADAAKRPQPPVGYPIEVTFSLTYFVQWWETSGQRADACDYWRREDGANTVVVRNLGRKTKPKRLKPLTGLFRVSGSQTIAGVKLPFSAATLNVVGDAATQVTRVWVQDGGPTSTPCGGRPVSIFKRKPDDCGTKRGSTSHAVIDSAFRKDWSDLRTITRPLMRGKRAVSVIVAFGDGDAPFGNQEAAWKPPFRTCKMTLAAPPLVLNLGLPVEEKDIQALKTLGLGRTHRLKWDIDGQCDNDEVNDDDNGCKFRVEGWVQIRHVSTFG